MLNLSTCQEIVQTKQVFFKNTQIERNQEESIEILQEQVPGFCLWLGGICGLYALGKSLNQGNRSYGDRSGVQEASYKRYSVKAQELGLIVLKKRYLKPAIVELHPHFRGENKVVKFLREVNETFLRGGSKMAERHLQRSFILQQKIDTSIDTSIDTAIKNININSSKNKECNNINAHTREEKVKEKSHWQGKSYPPGTSWRENSSKPKETVKYPPMSLDKFKEYLATEKRNVPDNRTQWQREADEYFKTPHPSDSISMTQALNMTLKHLGYPLLDESSNYEAKSEAFCDIVASRQAVTEEEKNPTKGSEALHPAVMFQSDIQSFLKRAQQN